MWWGHHKEDRTDIFQLGFHGGGHSFMSTRSMSNYTPNSQFLRVAKRRTCTDQYLDCSQTARTGEGMEFPNTIPLSVDGIRKGWIPADSMDG